MLSEHLRNVSNKKKKWQNSATALLSGNDFVKRLPCTDEGWKVLPSPTLGFGPTQLPGRPHLNQGGFSILNLRVKEWCQKKKSDKESK